MRTVGVTASIRPLYRSMIPITTEKTLIPNRILRVFHIFFFTK